MQHNKRRLIRKAAGAGYSIGFDMPAEEFYEYHRSCLSKRGKTISHSCELFKRVHDAAYQHQQGRTMFLKNSKGVVLCALFNIWDSNWGYDLIGSIAPEESGTGGQDFLIYNMIQFLSDKVAGYDFEGSMIEGVEQSRRLFGSVQTPYFSVQKVFTRNPLIKAAIAYKLKKTVPELMS